jgi:hypothetical protein
MSDVQNHIHLSMTIGGSPENAPNMKWKVRDDGRVEIPVFRAAIEEGLLGDVFAYAVKRAGQVVRRTDFQYILKVDANETYTTEERKEFLKAMTGETVYLVDHYHVDDGEDHTAYIQTMFFESVGEFRSDVLSLEYYYVPVKLVNRTTSP